MVDQLIIRDHTSVYHIKGYVQGTQPLVGGYYEILLRSLVNDAYRDHRNETSRTRKEYGMSSVPPMISPNHSSPFSVTGHHIVDLVEGRSSR